MSISRRALLKGASALGGATALPFATSATRPALAVYDGRLPEARAFAAAQRRKGIRSVDISGDYNILWTVAREELRLAGPVIGLTGWSDWVVLRGLMEDQGKRMVREQRIHHNGSRIATPFQWTMT